MIIVDFSRLSPNHADIAPQFMDMLIDTIQSEVHAHLNVTALAHKEQLLLKASWMRWYKKPKRINMVKLANLILHHLQWEKIGESMYKINVNPQVRLYGSSNTLEQVARWIEHGDESLARPILFISHAENLIRHKVPKYWGAFVQSKEGAVRIHECIYVR